MKWKKSGARNNPKRGVLIPAPVPCLSNVRNSLSLIRRKSTDSDHKGIETLETNSPSTSSSVSIAQTSMESLCRIVDEGIYGKDESSYSSIERTRDASFKSPKLFGLDDSISSVSRDNLHVHPIKRKAVLHGTSETGSSQIKNSTMNQSAIEAGTMAIDNVSPIKDHKGKRKRGRSSPWSFPDEGQTFQEPSSIETGCRDKIPTHIHAFMKKFQNVGQQHEDSPDTPSDDEDLENWSQIKPQDKISLCEWLSPKQLAKKTLRTFSHKDRRSAFEKCPDEVANFPGESYRTSSPAAPINDAASSKNMDLNLQFSSIRECREDSEVPLGRERTKKNTVNSEEIAADSEDYPSADCLTKDVRRVCEAGHAELPSVNLSLLSNVDISLRDGLGLYDANDGRVDKVETAIPAIYENLHVSLDVGECSPQEAPEYTKSDDRQIDATTELIPVVHLDPTYPNPVDYQGEQTTETPTAASSVPFDEIGLAVLNSPRPIKVHRCTPIISSDSIHSVPPDELGQI